MANPKKKIKEFDKLLQRFIDKKSIVEIERRVREGEANVHGIIVAMSKDFLLIQEVDGFMFSGFVIIRKDQFEMISCNRFDKTIKKILKGEGELSKNYGLNIKLDLKNWNTIFNDLMKNDVHVIVECEDIKEPSFTIGPIKKATKGVVQIRNYSATGKLDEKLSKIKYKNITILIFKDQYSTIFRKYLKK